MIALTEEQSDLGDAVRGIVGRVGRDAPDRLWSGLVGLELPAIPFPERHGGAGGTWKDAGVVVEALGEALADVPYLSSVGIAGAVLTSAESPSARARLSALAAGSADLALVGLPLDVRDESGSDLLYSATASDAARLSGTSTTSFGVSGEGALLVVASTADGPVLALVDTADEGVRIEELTSLDLGRPLRRVTLDGAVADIVGDADRLEYARCVIHALVAAEQLGIAEHCVAVATAYAKTREQFGRPIGSFQAVKHLVVDMHVATELARPAVLDALESLDDGRDAAQVWESILVARALASTAAEQATAGAIQVHGGIGFTWEHELHRYYRRALSLRLLFGSDAHCHRALGSIALND